LKFRSRFQQPKIWTKLQLIEKEYLMITLHRPGNVDEAKNLEMILQEILRHSRKLPIIFPVHPRTAKVLKEFKIKAENFHLLDPLSYLEFNFLLERTKAVITDSGGITEEATLLGVPCLTVRDNTER